MEFPDSIFALSSGRLPSGVAIVRMSGRHVTSALQALTGPLPQPRHARYASLRNRDGSIIDRGLVRYFPGPHSFTGEDCGELHIHGGRAGAAALMTRLSEVEGMRMAEAGEFTRRAFLNGKLDLTAAEALSDLIAAETEGQRRLAVEGAGGRQRDLYLGWRRDILRLRAEVEAQLDFSDEEDVLSAMAGGGTARIAELADAIERHAESYRQAEIVREGFRVAIIGRPNAGKSSLLNALARRDVAIVSDEAGTTRDVLEVALDLRGNKVLLMDTAGLRKAEGKVESIGIERALTAARDADLVLELVDLSAPDLSPVAGDLTTVRVGSKLDLAQGERIDVELSVSSKDGHGLEALLERLRSAAEDAIGSGHLLPLRARHREALMMASEALRQAAGSPPHLELCAEHLRRASDHLASIVGLIGTEELLGEIFSRFCIGK